MLSRALTAEDIEEVAFQPNADVEFCDSYSGRGMYGKLCVGVRGDKHDIDRYIFDLGGYAVIHGKDRPVMSFDSMGKDVILYFPGIAPRE